MVAPVGHVHGAVGGHAQPGGAVETHSGPAAVGVTGLVLVAAGQHHGRPAARRVTAQRALQHVHRPIGPHRHGRGRHVAPLVAERADGCFALATQQADLAPGRNAAYGVALPVAHVERAVGRGHQGGGLVEAGPTRQSAVVVARHVHLAGPHRQALRPFYPVNDVARLVAYKSHPAGYRHAVGPVQGRGCGVGHRGHWERAGHRRDRTRGADPAQHPAARHQQATVRLNGQAGGLRHGSRRALPIERSERGLASQRRYPAAGADGPHHIIQPVDHVERPIKPKSQDRGKAEAGRAGRGGIDVAAHVKLIADIRVPGPGPYRLRAIGQDAANNVVLSVLAGRAVHRAPGIHHKAFQRVQIQFGPRVAAARGVGQVPPPGAYRAARQANAPDAVIARVVHQQRAVGGPGQVLGVVEAGGRALAIHPTVFAGQARQCAHHPARPDAADAVVAHVGHVHGAVGGHSQPLRHVEAGLRPRSVAVAAHFVVVIQTGQRRHLPVWSAAAHRVAFGKIHRPIGPHRQPVGRQPGRGPAPIRRPVVVSEVHDAIIGLDAGHGHLAGHRAHLAGRRDAAQRRAIGHPQIAPLVHGQVAQLLEAGRCAAPVGIGRGQRVSDQRAHHQRPGWQRRGPLNWYRELRRGAHQPPPAAQQGQPGRAGHE